MASSNPSSIVLQAKQNADFTLMALNCNMQLRSTATNVFKFLCNCYVNDDRQGGDEATTSAAQPSNQQSPSAPANKFLTDFQEILSAVNKDFNEVEKHANMLTAISEPTFNLPMSWLSLDSTSDKLYKFRDTVQIQQWYRRLSEYSNTTLQALNKAWDRPRPISSQVGRLTRARKPHITKHLQIAPENMMKTVFTQISRTPQSHTAECIQQAGNHRIWKLTLAKTCTAYLVLWHLNVEKVIVKGLDETIVDQDRFDLETPSRIPIFRKITDLATQAMLHYSLTRTPNQLEYQFLLLVRFLVSYRTLFTEPCVFCKKVMKDGQPPYMRDFYRLLEVLHVTCKPQ